MEFTNVFNTALSHKSKLDNIKKDYDDNLLKINRQNGELKLINELSITTNLAYNYLEIAINEESTKFIQDIQAMLDYAVKTIFFDYDYSIDIKVEDVKANIYLCYTDDEGIAVRANIKDSIGGGVRTIVGIVLQVYYIQHYNAFPIIFMDEALSQVSEKYVPYMMAFLKELSSRLSFIFFLITHDTTRFEPYADKVYRMKKGKSSLIRIGQDNPMTSFNLEEGVSEA